jgi:hypothetical protein
MAGHVAERCRCDVAVDLFTGCGQNAIQLAFSCHRVIAIDSDARKLRCAQHNAAIYGVGDRIDFICGDALTLLPHLQADVIFLSPPWGGPEYVQLEKYLLAIHLLLQPMTAQVMASTANSKQCASGGDSTNADGVRLSTGDDGTDASARTVNGIGLLEMALAVSTEVAMYLPRNLCYDELRDWSKGYYCGSKQLQEGVEQQDGGQRAAAAIVEVEECVLNGKVKAVTTYFGALARR